MQVFIAKPRVDLYPGVKVDKDTTLEYKNDKVEQTVKDLVFHSVTKAEGEGYTSTIDTTITLQEGDVLIFEEEDRGYIKPVYDFVTVEEAIEELSCIKDIE
jgi:hypothetical protein